ncbi:MAG: hypothetical protein WED10_00035 [Brumimicrobium sp.]
MIVLLITILFIFGIIVFQDFKSRSIHWLLLPFLFVGLLFYTIESISFVDILFNLLFISIIIGSLILYLRIRQKEWVNPTKEFFGLGDILFLVAITPSENTKNFMFLFISGTIFSLLMTLLLRLMSTKFEIIPYAGMFSIFMMLFLVYTYFNPQFSFYKLIN